VAIVVMREEEEDPLAVVDINVYRMHKVPRNVV
jgi:hypothetical protein